MEKKEMIEMPRKLSNERKRKTLLDIDKEYKRFCSECGLIFKTKARKQQSKYRLCGHCKIKKLKTAIIIDGTEIILAMFKELHLKQKVQFNSRVDDYMKKVKEFKDAIEKQQKEKKKIEEVCVCGHIEHGDNSGYYEGCNIQGCKCKRWEEKKIEEGILFDTERKCVKCGKSSQVIFQGDIYCRPCCDKVKLKAIADIEDGVD